MTCAAAMPSVKREGSKIGMTRGWAELLDWHALEEVEHRTVAFNTFNHVSGNYFYRVFYGAKAQIHYLRYIHRFYRVMLRAKGFRVYPYIPLFILGGGVRYLNSFMPWYNPANYVVPQEVLERRLNAYMA